MGAWVCQLEEETRRHLSGEASGHDPAHAFRVRDLAVRLAAVVGADIEIVIPAALLHDIGHAAGRVDHAERGARLADGILSRSGFPAAKVSAVLTCIAHHHWQPGRAGDPPQASLEYQSFADADRLDALGAIGIARAFAFGGAHRRPIWDRQPVDEKEKPYGVSSIHHFYDKLLRLAGDMYTEPGRRLAAQRVAVMEEFLRIFYLEWEGNDVDITEFGEPLSLGTFPEGTIQVRDHTRRLSASVLQSDPIN